MTGNSLSFHLRCRQHLLLHIILLLHHVKVLVRRSQLSLRHKMFILRSSGFQLFKLRHSHLLPKHRDRPRFVLQPRLLVRFVLIVFVAAIQGDCQPLLNLLLTFRRLILDFTFVQRVGICCLNRLILRLKNCKGSEKGNKENT